MAALISGECHIPNGLFLKQISDDKIYTMLMELEPDKATGLDGLQVKFLIDSTQSIF